jgi:hypothetical protein
MVVGRIEASFVVLVCGVSLVWRKEIWCLDGRCGNW